MAKNRKKILNEKQEKILNWVLIIIQVIVVVTCIALSVFIIMGANAQKEEGKLGAGINMMVVLSDSMTGENKDSFSKGDMIFVKPITDESQYKDLEVGNIITYWGRLEGTNEIGFISHRIVDIIDNGNGTLSFVTKGDNPLSSTAIYGQSSVKGVYVGKIGKIGTIILKMQEPVAFFCIIVIPLALLLIYNVYLIIKMALDAKAKKYEKEKELAIEEIKRQALEKTIDEEEIKRKAIEEYLAKQKEEKKE